MAAWTFLVFAFEIRTGPRGEIRLVEAHRRDGTDLRWSTVDGHHVPLSSRHRLHYQLKDRSDLEYAVFDSVVR